MWKINKLYFDNFFIFLFISTKLGILYLWRKFKSCRRTNNVDSAYNNYLFNFMTSLSLQENIIRDFYMLSFYD